MAIADGPLNCAPPTNFNEYVVFQVQVPIFCTRHVLVKAAGVANVVPSGIVMSATYFPSSTQPIVPCVAVGAEVKVGAGVDVAAEVGGGFVADATDGGATDGGAPVGGATLAAGCVGKLALAVPPA